MKKTFLLTVTALLLCVLLLNSCSNTQPETVETTVQPTAETTAVPETTENPYDENGLLKDSLPGDLKFNSKCRVLGWETARNEFYVEMITEDRVNDSIYTRNKNVSDRLGVELEYTLIKGDNANRNAFVLQAEAAMDAGSCEYDVIGCYSMCAGILAQHGRLTDLYSLDYIDTSKPWWPQSMIRSSEINEKLYFLTGDISNEFLYNMYFLVVNNNMTEYFDLEDPRQLAKERRWTLDRMMEMCSVAYTDDNGNLVPDFGDRFGLIIFNQTHIDPFLAATGVQMTRWDENGNIVLSDDFKGEKMVDIVTTLGNWINTSKEISYDEKNGYNAIKAGNALFGTVAGSTITGFREVGWTYGILPFPMLDESVGCYNTNLGFAYTNYCVPVNAVNSEMSGAVIEALASDSYRNTSPTLFEVVFKSIYSNDPLDAQMYDIIKSNIYVDMARLYSGNFEWARSAVALFRNSVINNDTSWRTKMVSNEKYINGVFAEISESFKK